MSIPVPSRPATDASTAGSASALSLPKTRKSMPATPSRLRQPARPANDLATCSTSDLPTLKTQRSSLAAPHTIRKTISIGQFPQPPATTSRPGTASSLNSPSSPHKRASDVSRISSSTTISTKSKKTRHSDASALYRKTDAPSLLDDAGVSSAAVPLMSKRASDGQSSVPSPPGSRSSSANGSYSTNATTIDEGEEDRGRPKDLPEEVSSPKSATKGKEHKGNVTVSVRVRPDSNADNDNAGEGEWMVDGRRSLIAFRGKEGGDYVYDNVFGVNDDNRKVYDSGAKRLVRRVMEGYHGTVFAYGMTGTGKTFSMQGTATNPGVIPLAITDIFSYIRESPQREFLLRVSYLEIYNEKIHDLLAGPVTGNGPQEEIKLREDSRRGVYATPLREEIVQSPTQLLRVIARGDQARRTGSTQFNARSSRSHAVVQIVVESRERTSSGATPENKRVAMLPSGVRVSTLSLIDLAGSERAADDKERQKEGAHINKSLLTLGTVISRLSATKDKNGNPIDKDGKHLPYRDSKLTRLLQPALSGSSLVSILCTIQIGSAGPTTAASTHTMETLNTLKFAARAKNNIVSHAKKAVDEVGSGVNAGLLERYRNEIASLKSQLESQKKHTDVKEAKVEEVQAEKEVANRHEEQMLEMQLARTALKERIEHLNRLILSSKSIGVNSGAASSLGNPGRFSTSTVTDIGPSRSVRSSTSHSTLGTLNNTVSRHPSMASLGGVAQAFNAIADEEEDLGEHGDGMASLQAQNRALQADLQDKNRYITTLERRLLQARRSSHSRTSIGFSRVAPDDGDVHKQMDEKDAIIADLQKTVTALRSAMRQRSIADMTPESASSEFKPKKGLRIQIDGETPTNTTPPGSVKSPAERMSPVSLLSPPKNRDKKRKSVDEMSRMLDEMIQDKVESGHLIKGKSGSVRVPPRSASVAASSSIRRHSRRASSAQLTSVAPLTTTITSIRERDSLPEPVTTV